MMTAMALSVGLGAMHLSHAAALAPPWRGQAGSTYTEWRFDSSANPVLPETSTNTVPGQAAIAPGDFSSGWVQQLTGSWDLGRKGTISVPLGTDANGQALRCKNISVQVEQMTDGTIYGTLAGVAIPGATLLEAASHEVGGDSFAGWTLAQTLWQVDESATSVGPVVITGAYDGSVVTRVVLETLATNASPQNPVQLSIRRLNARQVEVTWPVVSEGSTLQWSSDLGNPQNWGPTGITPQINGETCTVIIDVTEQMRWLRVSQP